MLIHDIKFENLGKLYLDFHLLCYTLDPLKLPKDEYKIEVNYSPKFKTQLPLIYNDNILANRGFRIHSGNTLKDTNGCILVGDSYTIDLNNNIQLNNSKKTLNELLFSIGKNEIIKIY